METRKRNPFLMLLGIIFLLGIELVAFQGMEARWFMPFAAMLSAFIGAGIIAGFAGFKVRPKGIDGKGKLDINQTWTLFFIGCMLTEMIVYWLPFD